MIHKNLNTFQGNYERVVEWLIPQLEYDERDMSDAKRVGRLVPHGKFICEL